jgi:hypothetical protein
MSTTNTCTLCGALDSWRHSLFECNMAHSMWVLSDELVFEHMTVCGEGHAKHWVFHMIDTLPHEQSTRIAVTLWSI